MKYVLSVLSCFVVLMGATGVGRGDLPPGAVPRPEVELPFPVGEELEYEIFWGWISVGRSTANTRWEFKEGRWVIAIRFRTRTSGVVERLYPVDDEVVTYIDGETLKPLHFITKLSAGRHFRDEDTRFDWERQVAHYTRRDEEGNVREEETYEVEEGTRDLVSFMYFMRRTDFDENEEYEYDVVVNDKIYQLLVRSGEVEEVRLSDYGRVPSLRMDPRAKFEGVFVRRGEMTVWISEDERRILTKMEADTPFANVKLLLREVRGPGEDDWVR